MRETSAKPKGRALPASAQSRACYDEGEAEQVVRDGMARLHLTDAELQTTTGSDPRKAAIAKAVHERTAVTRQWTAGRLKMKSAVNVCQQIKRLKTGKLNLTREAKQWLSAIEP